MTNSWFTTFATVTCRVSHVSPLCTVLHVVRPGRPGWGAACWKRPNLQRRQHRCHVVMWSTLASHVTCFSCFSVLKPFWNHKFWSPYEVNLGQLRSTFWFSGCFVAQLWHRMVRRAAIRWAGPCCGWSVALGLRAVTNKHGVGWLDEVGRRWWNGVFEYIWVNIFCTTLTTLPMFQFLRGFWSVIGQITTETEKTCQSELLPVWTLILMYQ